MKLSLKERKEADRYLAYMPLGYNDWMICYAIPVKSAQQAYEFISGYEILFMGSFCILVLLLLLYIVVRITKRKQSWCVLPRRMRLQAFITERIRRR